MKKILMAIAKFLAKLAGGRFCVVPTIADDIFASARMFCGQVNGQATTGEHKRSQVLRALLNRHPGIKESTAALAIELVLCGADR